MSLKVFEFLLIAVCLAVSAQANAFELGEPKTIYEYYYPILGNFYAANGKVVIGDNDRNATAVIDLKSRRTTVIPTSAQPYHIVSTQKNVVAIADPFDGVISEVSIGDKPRLLRKYQFPKPHGVLFIAHENGIIYGTDITHQNLERLDSRFRRLPKSKIGSGPLDLVLLKDHIVILEGGAIAKAGDDVIAWYDRKTLRRAGGLRIAGVGRHLLKVSDTEVCWTATAANQIGCTWLSNGKISNVLADTNEYPTTAVQGDGYLWVLTRGDYYGGVGATIQAFHYQAGELKLVSEQPLTLGMEPLEIAYDESTNTMVVAGDTAVMAVPIKF